MKKDITEKRFGRLIVLRLDEEKNEQEKLKVKMGKKKKYLTYFICRCDCGNIKSIDRNALVTGKTKSCGCLNSEKTKERMFKDLTGKIFGKLSVIELDIERTENERNKYKKGEVQRSKSYWKCRCTCGNITSVCTASLMNGSTKSCGVCMDYKYNVGDIVNDLKIIDRTTIKDYKNNNRKGYILECLHDGYIFSRQEEYLKNKGCPLCAGKVVVKGINDIATTRPDLIKFFNNIEDCYKYTYSSSKSVIMKCPTCEKTKSMTINALAERGFSCNICSDGISYPEKFISSLLNQLKIDYIFQLTKTKMNWVENKKRYDFYLPNYNCIIEVHGLQHYKTSFKNRTIEEEQKNDMIKKELALKNGIKHYIELDCRKSDKTWIKQSILESNLPQLLSFKKEDIDWLKCEEDTCSSKIAESWEFYNKNKDIMTLRNMAIILNIHPSTLNYYLKRGAKIEKCDYIPQVKDNHITGITGVNFRESQNRWLATISINGKSKSKSFKTKEEAIQQRLEWEKEREEIYKNIK